MIPSCNESFHYQNVSPNLTLDQVIRPFTFRFTVAKVNLLNRKCITVSPPRITRLRLGDTEFSLPIRITRVRLGDTAFSLPKCITETKKGQVGNHCYQFLREHSSDTLSLLRCITKFVTKVYHQGKKKANLDIIDTNFSKNSVIRFRC